MLSGLLGGVSTTISAGSLNKTTVSSYEQMIIDHDMLRYVYRCLDGLVVNDDTLASEAMEHVRPGGDYVTAAHTLRHVRSGENLYLELFDRRAVGKRGDNLMHRAHNEVQAILSAHAPAVPESTRRAVADHVDRLLSM